MNPYALAWTLIALVGAMLSIYLLLEAVRDLRSLGELNNGRRKRVTARLASEAIRLLIHVPFAIIGFAALGTPTGALSWTIVILIGGNVGLIANSLIAVYVQRLEPSSTSVAEASARDLIEVARLAAEEILDVASRAAEQLKQAEMTESLERGADAAERTAVNTQRIAENTEPEK